MTDRELLESLGYNFENGEAVWLFHQDVNSLDEFIGEPAFFVEMDDALAARGAVTLLCRGNNGSVDEAYQYQAMGGTLDNAHSATCSTRNAAVREVYEATISKEHTNGL